MDISPSNIWLLLGVILIVIEFIQLPGIGFMFLGLGAISTSIITNYWTHEAAYQVGLFGITSLSWFLILWYPLRSFAYKNKNSNESFNMIGSKVTVVNQNIQTGEKGQVLWSGTIFNAKFSGKSHEVAKVQEVLVIKRIQGNTLICDKQMKKILITKNSEKKTR